MRLVKTESQAAPAPPDQGVTLVQLVLAAWTEPTASQADPADQVHQAAQSTSQLTATQVLQVSQVLAVTMVNQVWLELEVPLVTPV